VAGCCFSPTDFTVVTVNGTVIAGAVVAADGTSVTVPVPALLTPDRFANWTAPLAVPLVLRVTNGRGLHPVHFSAHLKHILLDTLGA
jgi:hypothetical protein